MGLEGTRLRVGLVGAGLVGQAAHAHFLWDEQDRFELVALADASATVRAAVGARYGIGELHASLDGLVGLGLDAVVVAVPDAYHADVSIQALEAGLHVLCEKPLALSIAECDRIAAARDAADRVVQVGTMKRFDPAYLKLLELLPDAPLDVLYVSVEVRDPDQGPFVDHFPMTVGRDLDPALGAELRARTNAAVREASGGEPAARRRARLRGLPLGDGARREPAAGHPRALRLALARACGRRRLVGRGPRDLALGAAARRRPRAPRPPQPPGRQRLLASASRCTAATGCSS